MNILVIEYEKHNQNRIIRLLKEINHNNTIVGVTPSVEESIEFLNTNVAIDLIIADICLSDGLSFEIFNIVKTDIPIIFTTAFDEYAIQAFNFNSVDYLLKPIKKDDLANAVNKVKQKERQSASSEIQALLHHFNQTQKNYRNRFLLPYKDGFRTINTRDIHHIHIENKITNLCLKDQKNYIITYSIEELEEQLNPQYFFRANRQYIIHIDSIKHIANYYNGKLKIILTDIEKTEIIISKDKSRVFKDWLDQ
ncbi:LytTR family DNA-binding domain-containing protein [Halosquirtibacter xylanolyticus]|uniref:LytR/AlgR family response regulator transcription factor n=1 Tax=Halosquirtibacter xylanolyticus TaxID=3374599 RepID=UPI003747DC93|nr:LytTR family DNA-binding domain-containing protein [Prolixibacteraceae bacterium]